MRLRSRVAIWCGKLACTMSRRLGKGSGSSLPGRVARKIDPEILSVMSGMVREKIIAVTGTNGKTTTTSLMAHVLTQSGKRVVWNRMGANLMDGAITSFVQAAGKSGRLEADYACIEVDEMASVRVFPLLKPVTSTIVILNAVTIFNDFTNPLYFLPGTENATVQQTLYNFTGQFASSYNLLFADVILITLPMLLLFVVFNKKIVDGMAAGSIKG